MRISFLELGFLLIVLTLIITCSVYLLGKSSGTPQEITLRRCGIALVVCSVAATGFMTHIFYYFPQIFEVEPAPQPPMSESEPTVSELEPAKSQPEEIPLVDYAEILRNSEQYDNQEVQVAGRISRLSDSDRQFIMFRDRLGCELDREFDINLYRQLSSGESASDYYQQGQYVIVQGKWEDWRKRLHGAVISTGEDARRAAQVFEDAWEAEMHGYADTTSIIDYMDFVTLSEKYAGQRVRTIGQVFSVQTNTTWEGEEYTLLFFQNRDPLGKSITLSLKGCPPKMQSSCAEGDYVLLSGIVDSYGTGLDSCFIESIGDDLQPLAEQFEAEWRERCAAEREAYFASCQEYAYEELARYPDKYEAERIVLTGTVVQTRLDNLDNHILLDAGQGNMVYVSYYGKLPNDPEILLGDQITFYGECYGNMSYNTAPSETNTVPWVMAHYSSFNQFSQ